MTFNSWQFLLFYPIVALLYFLLPKRTKWIMLLIASYYFYMCYQAELVFLIFGTTLISWLTSFVIERSDKKAVRRVCLTVTLVICLGVLFFYKYFNFLSGSLAGLITLFGGSVTPFELDLLLPVGVSFYTFQTLSYVIDVYRGDIKCERNFFFYALFVSFFPQIVAGPIERPGNLIPQLKEPKGWNSRDALVGAKYMAVGFFKKVAVADLLSSHVAAVYNSPEDAGALAVIIATALFAVQIYCDFSGYTDIATGAARIMGIRLMKNFDHPYTAVTIKEFWSRWYISLSSWFKDYLYFPLGGSRCKRWRHLFNLMVVFLVSGLWHGAAWTYVIWGALHGLYQIVGVLTIKKRNELLDAIGIGKDSLAVRIFRRAAVFILVSFAWIFFRAGSIGDAFYLVSRLFSGWGVGISDQLSMMDLDLTAALLSVLSIATLILIDRMEKEDTAIGENSACLTSRGAFIYYVWMIMLAWAILLAKGEGSTFIYFQF